MLTATLARPAHAIVVMGPQGNNFGVNQNGTSFPITPAPDGLDSLEGSYGLALGTPIASRYFLTANHVTPGPVNFTFQGQTYLCDKVSEIGNTDLAVFEIDPSVSASFPTWATMASSAPAANAPLVVLGEGAQRGSAVTGGWAPGPTSNQAHSWGTNTVAGVGTLNGAPAGFGGEFIAYSFIRTTDGMGNVTDPNEAMLSSGANGDDSGGGLFIQNPTTHVWELAGINSLVDSVSDTQNGPLNFDVLYDANGYWDGNNQITSDIPLSSYDTAIFSNLAAIESVVPEPASMAIVLGLVFPLLATRRARRPSCQRGS